MTPGSSDRLYFGGPAGGGGGGPAGMNAGSIGGTPTPGSRTAPCGNWFVAAGFGPVHTGGGADGCGSKGASAGTPYIHGSGALTGFGFGFAGAAYFAPPGSIT